MNVAGPLLEGQQEKAAHEFGQGLGLRKAADPGALAGGAGQLLRQAVGQRAQRHVGEFDRGLYLVRQREHRADQRVHAAFNIALKRGVCRICHGDGDHVFNLIDRYDATLFGEIPGQLADKLVLNHGFRGIHVRDAEGIAPQLPEQGLELRPVLGQIKHQREIVALEPLGQGSPFLRSENPVFNGQLHETRIA